MVRKVKAKFQNLDDKISAGLNSIEEEKGKIREDVFNKVNMYKTDINNLIEGKFNEINGLKQDIEKEKKMIEGILKDQKYQNRYIQRINQYIFNASSIVDYDLANKVAVQEIRERTHRYFRLIIVYLPWSDDTESAFQYLQASGIKEDIDDLIFIAENDPDERKRNKAREAIGAINIRVEGYPGV